tara:strand:- start:11941 stop:12819 length:879 start_codon:yes stop_codon:yes gene_type:complete
MTDPFMKPEHLQGSAEWLAHRQNYLGASDAPIVMGVSPWKTQFQLWEDKLGMSAPQEENFYMRRGSDMEPLARAAFEVEFGLEVFPQIAYHPKHKFMMASLDGLTIDKDHAVEIKCPGPKSHKTAVGGVVPIHYMPQLQHQLACLDLPMLWYWSFDGENGVAIKVERDDAYIKLMIEEEAKFWECVKTRTPPPFTDKDYVNKNSAVWSAYAHRVGEIDAEVARLSDEKEKIKQALLDDSCGRSSRCGALTLRKSFPKGRIDYGAIPELKGVDVEQYRKEAKEQWTMKVSTKS